MSRKLHIILQPYIFAPPIFCHLLAGTQARCASIGPEASESAGDLGRQAADLSLGLRDVSELYNDYAQPHKVRKLLCGV